MAQPVSSTRNVSYCSIAPFKIIDAWTWHSTTKVLIIRETFQTREGR